VLGAVRRHRDLILPDRHLGLVQAMEHPDLEAFLERAAAVIGHEVDLPALAAAARPLALPRPPAGAGAGIPPLGQRVAIARDEAFAFAYDWLLEGWRAAGVEVLPFSPLSDQEPARDADAVFLPGGYPELHAGRLAGNRGFLDGLRAAAGAGKPVYGECGGYMVLGRGLIDMPWPVCWPSKPRSRPAGCIWGTVRWNWPGRRRWVRPAPAFGATNSTSPRCRTGPEPERRRPPARCSTAATPRGWRARPPANARDRSAAPSST